jgi:hypothetical protein
MRDAMAAGADAAARLIYPRYRYLRGVVAAVVELQGLRKVNIVEPPIGGD